MICFWGTVVVGLFTLLPVQNINNVINVIQNTSRVSILHQQQLPQFIQQERKRESEEQMRKQRKVRVRMRFTLYFPGVKESHFVYRPVNVFFR